jgi:hypothetical protein
MRTLVSVLGHLVSWPDSCEPSYILPEALFPRHFEYETVISEEFSLEDRIVVAGIPVSIKVECFSVEIVIEGQMEEAQAVASFRTSRRVSRPTRGYRAC